MRSMSIAVIYFNCMLWSTYCMYVVCNEVSCNCAQICSPQGGAAHPLNAFSHLHSFASTIRLVNSHFTRFVEAVFCFFFNRPLVFIMLLSNASQKDSCPVLVLSATVFVPLSLSDESLQPLAGGRDVTPLQLLWNLRQKTPFCHDSHTIFIQLILFYVYNSPLALNGPVYAQKLVAWFVK